MERREPGGAAGEEGSEHGTRAAGPAQAAGPGTDLGGELGQHLLSAELGRVRGWRRAGDAL